MNILENHWFKGIVVVVLLLATVLSSTGHLDSFINKCGITRITDANETYLASSFKKSMHGFLVLSAIKSGVAVIEGSEIGIGFNLEVGDIAQSVYDYVDVAWKTALAGSTVLLLMRVTLETIQLVDQWALFLMLLIALILILFGYVFPKQEHKKQILKECLSFSAILVLALYLILPISISGAAFLSKQITSPLVEEAQSGFESFQEDLSPAALNQRFFPDSQEEDSLWSRLDFSAKLQNSRDALMKLAQYPVLQEAWMNAMSKTR